MHTKLPYNEACENNKNPILVVLQKYIDKQQSLLEIGGGSGQHGEFFAQHFPALMWQTSDIPEVVDTLNLRICASGLPNLPKAIPINVDNTNWNAGVHDLIFTANSLHIMSENSVRNFFYGIPKVLRSDGLLFIYGPFKYGGKFTTKSNANFNDWLKSHDSKSGLRDFESVISLAAQAGLNFIEDNSMPANNQMLVFSKTN